MDDHLGQSVGLSQGQSLAFKRGAIVVDGWQRYLSLDFWVGLVGGSSGLMLMAIVFACSFVAGYFAKRYARLLIIFLVLMFLIGAACEHFGIVTIHWDVVRELLGDHALPQTAYSPERLVSLVREHYMFIVVGLVAFIVGHIIG